MSDATDAAETAFNATLVRGRVYFYKSYEFQNGVPQKVSLADKEYLEANAVDLITIESEGEHQSRQKFKFSPVGAEAEAEPVVRTRTRGR